MKPDDNDTPGKGQTSITSWLRGAISSLSKAEQAIGQIILDQPHDVANLTISELAEQAGTSDATITRFCKRLGLAGYPQLRLQLAAEADRLRADNRPGLSLSEDITEADSLTTIVQKTAYADIKAAEETVAQLDLAALAQLIDAVAAARRVVVFGVGSLGFVAQDISQKLFRIGINASAWADIHNGLVAASLLGPKDLALVLTHSGRTVENLEVLSLARKRKARCAVVTSNPLSSAAKAADILLVTAARETVFRIGGMASRSAQQIILDCLYVALAHRQFDRSSEMFAEAHDAVRHHRKDN